MLMAWHHTHYTNIQWNVFQMAIWKTIFSTLFSKAVKPINLSVTRVKDSKVEWEVSVRSRNRKTPCVGTTIERIRLVRVSELGFTTLSAKTCKKGKTCQYKHKCERVLKAYPLPIESVLSLCTCGKWKWMNKEWE